MDFITLTYSTCCSENSLNIVSSWKNKTPQEGFRSFWMALNSWMTALAHASLCSWFSTRAIVWLMKTKVSTVLSKSWRLRGWRRWASSAVRRRMSESVLGRTSSQMTSSFSTLLRDANSSSGIIRVVWSASPICIPASRISKSRLTSSTERWNVGLISEYVPRFIL